MHFESEILNGTGISTAVGFPTANLAQLTQTLQHGVYVAYVRIKGLAQIYNGMVISGKDGIQVHMYAYTGEHIVGEILEVDIIKSVRGPRPVKVISGIRQAKTSNTALRQKLVAYNYAAQKFFEGV